MVELITTDDVVYLTDSAGRVALHEPELSAETVFFKVKSAGYQASKDGFGIEGVRLVLGRIVPGLGFGEKGPFTRKAKRGSQGQTEQLIN